MESIDERIRQKEREIRELKLQEIELKRADLREIGKVSDSLDDLVCDQHGKPGFIEFQASLFYRAPVDYAACSSCVEEELGKLKKTLDDVEVSDDGKLNWSPHNASVAYLCKPNFGGDGGCGWVIGTPIEEYYKSPPETWSALAGREGNNYSCKICGTYLGSKWSVVS